MLRQPGALLPIRRRVRSFAKEMFQSPEHLKGVGRGDNETIA